MASATAASETVAARNPPLFDRNAAIQWFVAALTLFLVVLPLLPIFYQAFLDKPLYYPDAAATLGNFTDLFGEAEFRTVIVNTLYFAAVMTVIAQSVGIGCAILIGRTDLPGRQHLRRHPAVAAVHLASRAGVRLVHHVRAVRLHHACGAVGARCGAVEPLQPDRHGRRGRAGPGAAGLSLLHRIGDLGRRVARGRRPQRRRGNLDGVAADHAAVDAPVDHLQHDHEFRDGAGGPVDSAGVRRARGDRGVYHLPVQPRVPDFDAGLWAGCRRVVLHAGARDGADRDAGPADAQPRAVRHRRRQGNPPARVSPRPLALGRLCLHAGLCRFRDHRGHRRAGAALDRQPVVAAGADLGSVQLGKLRGHRLLPGLSAVHRQYDPDIHRRGDHRDRPCRADRAGLHTLAISASRVGSSTSR